MKKTTAFHLFHAGCLNSGFTVFENTALRIIFERKKEEVKTRLRKLHNVGLHNLHSSLTIVEVLKSRRMRLVGPIVHTEK
jgi:ABC-type transporter Mla maintaining outer membrane lipid asymmetry ATPase subunit MlaF